MKTVIRVEHIVKHFGQKVVHQDINFEVFEGEMLGLLGGSGTGKSVMLRSLIGLERPDSGKIFVFDQNIVAMTEAQLRAIRKKVGYVFQNGALFDSLTVGDNIAYPLREHTDLPEKEIQAKVEAILTRVNMQNTRDLMPAELSGGMQKRAGLARAIILEPAIILFDEPTAGLDPMNSENLLQHIKHLREQRVTGIFVTHDIPACFEICDRIAIIHQGKIYSIEETKKIRQSNDPIVRQYFYKFL
jgi:phospholipid/cholesterol/gamma-HCH transport system ATP-binding protein